MDIAVVTGSHGLVGSESVKFLASKFNLVLGIDNDMRAYFFGKEASTDWMGKSLLSQFSNYRNINCDIRDYASLESIFQEYESDIKLVIHTAAQPSHDWAAKEPLVDFSVNANGTLNLLELTRKYCPKSVFIFTSTNKVYGDTPNNLPLVELDTRYEIASNHEYFSQGINETLTIDQSRHSLFGASKVAADVMAQEYGKYFNMNVGVFRGGCLTGPNHSGTQLHGFLSYLMKCVLTQEPYTIFGYKGKQVRDNIHSYDLVNMFWNFYSDPKQGEVYNVGGGRFANCSMLEAISMCEQIAGKKLNKIYSDLPRSGDHIWWISDVSKFKKHFPAWNWTYDIHRTLFEIYNGLSTRSLQT